MKRHGSIARSAILSPRYILGRLLFILFLGASIALVLGSRYEYRYAAAIEASMTDAVAPIMALASQPVESLSNFAAAVSGLFTVYADNQALRAENERLKQWQIVASQMQAENEELRKLLSATPALTKRYITAKVIGESGGGFSRSAIINAGSNSGVARGQVVLNHDGIVGRITTVGNLSARVLFLNDINSNIPVIIGESQTRAILAGTNDTLPVMRYLPAEANIKAGDMIFTSGDGGIFARGQPVGKIAFISEDGTAHVRPLADLAALQYVTVIEQEAVAAPEQP